VFSADANKLATSWLHLRPRVRNVLCLITWAGVNLWPRLSGRNSTPPRRELWGGPNFLISGDFKLVLGSVVTYAVWTGAQSPNATTEAEKQFFLQWNCSTCTPPVTLGRINCSAGCLCASHETLCNRHPDRLSCNQFRHLHTSPFTCLSCTAALLLHIWMCRQRG
jgi:hypothetical protein